jgi:heat shock protein HtpX
LSTSKNFRSELTRLKKGIKVAWAINFVLLTLTYEAAMIFVGLSNKITNEALIVFIAGTLVIAAIASAITIVVVTARSSKILMTAASRDLERVTSGPIFNMVEEMAIAAGVRGSKFPEVFIARNTGVANAYALSDAKGNSRVIVTEEILQILNREELQAVIAHEFGHIVSGDSQDMTKLIALTSSVSIISGVATRFWGGGGNNNSKNNPIAIVLIILSGIFLLIAPLLSNLSQAYMSRTRETQADALSVKFTRNPTALAKALLKLEQTSGQMSKEKMKKFGGKVGSLAFYAPSLKGLSFATHPPTDARLEVLIAMGAQMDSR